MSTSTTKPSELLKDATPAQIEAWLKAANQAVVASLPVTPADHTRLAAQVQAAIMEEKK